MRYHDGKPVEATVDRRLDPASRRGDDVRRRRARSSSPIVREALPEDWIDADDRLARQPDRQVRHRRPGRRLPASPAARSSSTPMAARRRMAAAPSPARTRPRSTARPPMPRATSPRTSSPPASPTAAPSSSPMPSASPQPLSIYVDLHGTGKVDEEPAREGARARSWTCRRAASASISASTSRSMRAPPPMAISAARRKPTAASPGRRPTSSSAIRDAVALTGVDAPSARATAMDDGAMPATAGARASRSRPAATGLMATRCRRSPIDLAAPPPAPLAALFPVPVDGGAARDRLRRRRASDRRGAGRAGDRLHRRRALRQRHGQGGRRDRRQRRSATSASSAATRRASSTGCRRPRSPGSTCSIPTPGRSSGTGSAASSARTISTASPACLRRAASSASPPTSTPMSTGRSLHLAGAPDFAWTAERADDWRQPFPGWPGRATRPRRSPPGGGPTYLAFQTPVIEP